MTDIRQELLEKAKAMGIKLTAQQADQFQTYMEQIGRASCRERV